MKPDEVTYNSVINACARKSEAKQAEQWLERMCKAGMKPDIVGYTPTRDA